MPRYHVWVSQLRTLDIVVEKDSPHEAEARVRTRLGDLPEAQPWLNSATVIRSVLDQAAPSREMATFQLSQQLLKTTDAGKYLSVSRTKVYELINLRRTGVGHDRTISPSQRGSASAVPRVTDLICPSATAAYVSRCTRCAAIFDVSFSTSSELSIVEWASARDERLPSIIAPPRSGSKSKVSLPQNNASIAAAAITVFPAPVVAVSENDEISRLSGLLKLSRARFRLTRTSSTACSW